MSQPQDGPVRVAQKRRRTRQLAAWRAKQVAAAEAPPAKAAAAPAKAKAKPAAAAAKS